MRGDRYLCLRQFRLQRVHNAAHGGRAYLLSPGQVIQGNGPAKDDHGKRGQPGRADAASGVLHADQPQQVDGGAVQLVGQFFCCCSFYFYAFYSAPLAIN